MNAKKGQTLSRREFARRAAFVSAAASLGPSSILSVPPSVKDAPEEPQNAPKLSPEGQAEAEGRYQSILAQYGNRFSEAQKADLRRLAIAAQPALDRLRAYPIQNGDSPALYLKPLVEREKKPVPAAKPPAPGKKD